MADLKEKIKKLNSLKMEPIVEYIWESNRLRSLKNWPMVKPSAEEMAHSGFYCPNTDYPGIVKCFSCFIELDGWEPTDNPWEEHKKRAVTLNPPCKFIEIGKKESDHMVDDFLDILKSVIIRVINKTFDKNLNTMLVLHKKKKTSLKKELQKLGIP